MNAIEAFILGLVQGLTEFLPVSSSGHLTIFSHLFGIDGESNLTFNIVVHTATVLSTIVVLRHEVFWIFTGLFTKQMNSAKRYLINILVSMVPVGIVGVFFKDYVEEAFGSGLLIVGICLLLTACLLTFSYIYNPRQITDVRLSKAAVIGLSQAVAVLPGLSRSGTTIATGLLLGVDKAKMAQFSFLMVIPPILGEALLDGKKIIESSAAGTSEISLTVLAIGFLTAFISGCLACKFMIDIVRRGKLIYFAAYCLLAGIATIILNYTL